MSLHRAYLALGTMSGTSADGVDVALLRSDGESQYEFLGSQTVPYREQDRQALLQVAVDDRPFIELLRLERRITKRHAVACMELLSEQKVGAKDIVVLGFHGHTIRHVPEERFTWQLGNAALLSELTGIPVVSDFRRADLAAGGQGAPLAPLFHQMLLSRLLREKEVLVLNLGGVANLTWLKPDGTIRAGDTGPGCGLLDSWAQHCVGKPCDEDGKLAMRGAISKKVVEAALSDSFFQIPFPKSADRHQFHVAGMDELSPQDGAATLCAITVEAIKLSADQMGARPDVVCVCGGGAKHPAMMSLLTDKFRNVVPAEQLGLHADSMEAECFGWLAIRRWLGLATSIPETTGCARPVVGGAIAGVRSK